MTRILRQSIVLAMMASIILLFGCDDEETIIGSGDGNVDNTNFEATAAFSFDIDVASHTQVRVEGINGNVSFDGQPGRTVVTIAGERTVGSESLADAEAHLDELQVSVSDLGDEIFAQTTQPDDTQGRSYIVDYNITLPQNLAAFVTNLNGSVTVRTLENRVTAFVANGQVILDAITGDTFADLTNGQITAYIIVPLDGTADLSIVNGNIDLEIPTNTSADLTATVVNGIITTSNLDFQNLTQTSTSLSGTLGDGRGTITLSTANGNIEITGTFD
jgi:DUF4097 and DUF4098 domain-containing protein YvlB